MVNTHSILETKVAVPKIKVRVSLKDAADD